MHRRTFLASSTAALIAARPALAQQLSLNAISSYLNGIETAQSSFTQVNDDGTLATGTLYIRRPGRMRFEYDPIPIYWLWPVRGRSASLMENRTSARQSGTL